MHEFHNNYMKIKYGNNSILLLTDTDSLMYEVKTDNIYEEIKDKGDLILVILQLNQNIMIISLHSLLVDDSSEHKKQRV